MHIKIAEYQKVVMPLQNQLVQIRRYYRKKMNMRIVKVVSAKKFHITELHAAQPDKFFFFLSYFAVTIYSELVTKDDAHITKSSGMMTLS